MTTFAASRTAIALRRAAVRATLAPSVHNTQPWKMTLDGPVLSLFADYDRQLPVLDPTSRQLTISCGCALLNARVSLAADGIAVTIARMPDESRPDLLATITADESGEVESYLAGLDAVVDIRRTNRRHFESDPVPEDVLDIISACAAGEGAQLVLIHNDDQRIAVTVLAQRADEIQNLNTAYRAEVRAWTTDDPGRLDGVPDAAIPHVDGTAHDDLPMRDFDMHSGGALPAQTASSRKQTLALLCTASDGRIDWLRAGEAMEHALLEIARNGYVASPMTQITEVASTRAALRDELGINGSLHVLLRIGRAQSTPATRRRRIGDVLTEEI